MDGYIVDKLEPDKLDRESAYGTPAASGETNAAAFPTSFPNAVKGEVRVYDPAATFSIQKVEGGAYVVPPGTPAKAEINAGGAVIYGYSLRVSAAGEYRVTSTSRRMSPSRGRMAGPSRRTASASSSPWWRRWRWRQEVMTVT